MSFASGCREGVLLSDALRGPLAFTLQALVNLDRIQLVVRDGRSDLCFGEPRVVRPRLVGARSGILPRADDLPDVERRAGNHGSESHGTVREQDPRRTPHAYSLRQPVQFSAGPRVPSFSTLLLDLTLQILGQAQTSGFRPHDLVSRTEGCALCTPCTNLVRHLLRLLPNEPRAVRRGYRAFP